ncbi:SMP-30/gluconolactonase/LRE family protein [Actinoplanes sp. L3-i22]|uniref:SMP-30/gluconolactonase/LRE family protein n=1 Tax=Actinoplanes sp. L3-i22 TaxID=2836373 RepID=UPI001C796910|nr:SMP-30/gluconolactonase/LRE family protein [Actinoplanes sp. L3-i22]BCY09358.1 hypothetical protein L3i22_044460 [Actinoplanes sp. L3-i22]
MIELSRRLRYALLILVAIVLVEPWALPAHADTSQSAIVVPEPATGSYFTLFNYAPDGRIVVFDGFTVSIQVAPNSTRFRPIGTLPESFLGGTDPAFVTVDPDGRQVLLGGGAGGSKYPDPAFNGAVFRMPLTGGTAVRTGTFPYSIGGEFWNDDLFLMGQGETFGTFTGSVEVLDVARGTTRPLVARIPGDPGGIALDSRQNLYVGLGAGQDTSRTGEIHRFGHDAVRRAMRTGQPLDFDADGRLVTQVLNAGDLAFGPRGELYVGGGDFQARQDFGYVAVVDVRTGQVLRRLDPVDGDPADGDQRSFDIATRPGACRLAALDLFSFFSADPSVIHLVSVC